MNMPSVHCFIPLFMWMTLSIILIHAGTIRSTQDNDYEYASLNCTTGEPCDIFCAHPSACLGATIRCPSGHACNVTCSDKSSCQDTIIYAQNSSLFRLADCASGSWTCIGLSIYLPPNDHGQPNAILIGGDRGFSAGENYLHPLHFYAIYGWNDVHIVVDDKHSFDYHHGIMHCTAGYGSSCNFSDTAWSCADPNHLCNDPPTLAPTLHPTLPTASPIRYTTTHPTIVPTRTPTHHPTTDPVQPTTHPTYNPTDGPSYTPSFIQTIHPSTSHPSTSALTTWNGTTQTSASPPTLLPTVSPIYYVHTTSFASVQGSIESSSVPVAQNNAIWSEIVELHPLYVVIIGLTVLLLCFVLLFAFWCRRARRKQKVDPLNYTISNKVSMEKEHSYSQKEGDGAQDATEPHIVEIAPLKVASPLRLYTRHNRAISAGSALSAVSALSALSGMSAMSKTNSINSPSVEDHKRDTHIKQFSTDLSHLRPMSVPAQSMHQTTPSALSVSSLGYAAAAAVNNNDAWEEQMRALRQQWQHIQSMSPRIQNGTQTATAANFGDPIHDHHTYNSSNPNIYDDVPSTAPAIMDHNVFFNQMLRTFNAHQPNAIQPSFLAPSSVEHEAASQLSDNRSVLSEAQAQSEYTNQSIHEVSVSHTTSDSNSDSEYSGMSGSTTTTATTATTATSVTSTGTYKSRKTRKAHFRAPSVMTDQHLSEDEDTMDLPTLIEIDEREAIENDHDLNMIPEHNEEDSETTMESASNHSDKPNEDTREYSDSMAHEDDEDSEEFDQSDSNSVSHTQTYTNNTISDDKRQYLEMNTEHISEDGTSEDTQDIESYHGMHRIVLMTHNDIRKSFDHEDQPSDEDQEHQYYDDYYDEYED